MAKSARASAKKASRSKLRDNIFGPVEHARLERMEKKLMDMASQPKPERPEEMEIDPSSRKNYGNSGNAISADGDVAMEDEPFPNSSSNKQKTGSKKLSRVQKRKQRRSSTSIIFPVKKKVRKVTASDKRTKK